MTKDRIAIVADWLEEKGFTPEEVENVKQALQSPPVWFPLAVVSGVTVDVDADGWTATIVGVDGRLPPQIRRAFEDSSTLQLGLRGR